MSLDWSIDVLKMGLPQDDANMLSAVMRAKGQASQTVLTLLARTNEAQLKRQTLDKLSDLVKIIQDEEHKMKLVKQIG